MQSRSMGILLEPGPGADTVALVETVRGDAQRANRAYHSDRTDRRDRTPAAAVAATQIPLEEIAKKRLAGLVGI